MSKGGTLKRRRVAISKLKSKKAMKFVCDSGLIPINNLYDCHPLLLIIIVDDMQVN